MRDSEGNAALDTFPRLLLQHARTRPNEPAMREKDLGIWQSYTWQQVADEVRALACGLAEQGFKRGMNLAIVGDNRPRLYWAFTAAQALGGVPVPLYQDAVAQEMVFVLDNAEIEFAIVEDQEQVDKLLEALPQLPKLKHICYEDARGLRYYDQPFLMSFDRLLEIGRHFDQQNPGFFAAEVAAGRADDVSVILYTSGTTGKLNEFAFEAGVGMGVSDPDEKEHVFLLEQIVKDHLKETVSLPDFSPAQIRKVLNKHRPLRRMITKLVDYVGGGKKIAASESYADLLSAFNNALRNLPDVDAASFRADLGQLIPHYKEMTGKEVPFQIEMISKILEEKNCTVETFDQLISEELFLENMKKGNLKARAKLPDSAALHYPGLIEEMRL